MKLVYVAGPYRAPTPWAVEQNIRRAEEWAYKVAEAGHIPLCPHTMYRNFNGTMTDDFWLKATLGLLRRADVVIFVPDWRKSSGSLVEHIEAKKLKMPSWAFGPGEGFRCPEDMVEWMGRL